MQAWFEADMASSILKGLVANYGKLGYQLWHRPFKMASLVYEREIGDDDGVVQDGGHSLNNRLTETCSLGLRLLLWYWTSMFWSMDTCQNKVSADQYHVTISQAQVYSLSRSRVLKLTADQVLVFRLDRGLRIVRKPANGSPGLKFISNITFSSIQMLFATLFWV